MPPEPRKARDGRAPHRTFRRAAGRKQLAEINRQADTRFYAVLTPEKLPTSRPRLTIRAPDAGTLLANRLICPTIRDYGERINFFESYKRQTVAAWPPELILLLHGCGLPCPGSNSSRSSHIDRGS